jgi:hypothetical protein
VLDPTPEQAKVIELAVAGKNLAVDALAGTGKTSTCVMVADAKPERGLYLTFNKALQKEAEKKFPGHVEPRTTHSLAFQSVGRQFGPRLRGARMKSAEIARRLNIAPIMFEHEHGAQRLAPGFLAGMVTRGIRRFCASAEAQPEAHHIPMPTTVRDDKELMLAWRSLRPRLVPALRLAWEDMMNPEGVLPYTHDAYLKMFQLSEPKLECDYLLLDEAQDTSDCVLSIVDGQRAHSQIIVIGDTHQSIYQWRGAVDAMTKAQVDDRAALTWSWRFGPEIAEQANEVLALLTDERLVGKAPSGTVGPIETPDVILARTNAEAVGLAFETHEEGGKPHVVGGATDVISFAQGAKSLMESGWTSHPELVCFETWSDVEDYARDDELGTDLSMLVKLVRHFGADEIVRVLKGQPSEAKATRILSTAHGAKGREWDSVKLAKDFPAEPEGEEIRLLYVGVTRPKRELDVTQVKLLNPEPDEESPSKAPDQAPAEAVA